MFPEYYFLILSSCSHPPAFCITEDKMKKTTCFISLAIAALFISCSSTTDDASISLSVPREIVSSVFKSSDSPAQSDYAVKKLTPKRMTLQKTQIPSLHSVEFRQERKFLLLQRYTVLTMKIHRNTACTQDSQEKSPLSPETTQSPLS